MKNKLKHLPAYTVAWLFLALCFLLVTCIILLGVVFESWIAVNIFQYFIGDISLKAMIGYNLLFSLFGVDLFAKLHEVSSDKEKLNTDKTKENFETLKKALSRFLLVKASCFIVFVFAWVLHLFF